MRRQRLERRGATGRSRPAAPGPPGDVLESPETLRRATLAARLLIAAFAATLLFIVLGPHRIGAFDVETDFYGGYAPVAMAIQHGHLLDAGGKLPMVFGFVGPLYPSLLALAGMALGDLFRAAGLISLVACVAAVTFWFLLLRRRAGAGLALVVVALLVTNPLLVRYGYSVTTDTTALALQAAALLVLSTRGGRAAAAAAGILAGLATLTRYTGVYLVPAGIIAILTRATLHPRRRQAALAFVLGFLALVLPWQVYARSHGLELQFHQLLAFDVYGTARGVGWDDFLAGIWPRFEHDPLAVLTADPGAVVSRLLFNLGDHLRLDALRLLLWPIAVLAALAPLLALRDRRIFGLAPLALPGAWAFLALVPAGHNQRYSLAVLPFYLLLAGATLTSRAWLVTRGRRPVLARAALVVATVVMSLGAAVHEQLFVLSQQPVEILACADRLRQLARPDDRVIARKPNVAFHAGVGFVYFPQVDRLEGLARHARENRARWLFVSVAEVELRPQMAFLLDTTSAVPGLTLRKYSSVSTPLEGHPWQSVAALYEIGPEFGRDPGWFASDTLRALHVLRGRALVMPDVDACLRLARVELLLHDRAAAQGAWRTAARIDPPGIATFLRQFDNDTAKAVMDGLPLIESNRH